MRYLPLLLIFVCGVCFGDTVERKNIKVDSLYKSDGVTYYMCNLYAKPDTILTNVKDCVFERCNLYDCVVDKSNTLKKSNFIDSTIIPELPEEEKRIKQLEDFIKSKGLIVPSKEKI